MNSDPVRDEAERLVAAAIVTISSAARGLGFGSRGGFATGDPECCICPLCRVIAAMRDPSPETAERIATGAGDLAAGVASMLRALAGDHRPQPQPENENADADDVWRAATLFEEGTAEPSPPQRKPMAKKAVKKAAAPDRDDTDVSPSDDASPSDPETERP